MSASTAAGWHVDHEGDRWPLSGYLCRECQMPMHPVNLAFGTHPACDVGEVGP